MRPGSDARPTVEDNIGLVHLCARRFAGKGMEYDDLFQAGCVGLVKAADGFDPDRGAQFSTYAVPVILGEIRRLFREGSAVRVSRGMRDLARRARIAEAALENELGRPPDVSELAARLEITVEKAALALGAARAPLSLTGEEEGEQLEIPVDAPEEQMTERMTLYEILRTMEERDRRLIEYRYFQSKTQQETGALLGMTQVQVSRREKKLLLYMRESFLE